MRVTLKYKKNKEANGYASTSPEGYEERIKGFYFVAKTMQPPDARSLPVPTFNGRGFIK